MEREQAISIIVQQELGEMSKDERESELWNLWGMDEEYSGIKPRTS